MTYWYETSEDKKGAWHWIGVAISLAYTLCLHRDPSTTSMSSARQKLYKRIWWSCFMRDRLIALGMRQPSRIHDKDFDVPMLEESDFDIEVFPQDDNILPRQCAVVRDITMQHELADLFIAKVQLCICIGHELNSMYSDDMRNKVIPENTTNSTSMLLPKKKLDNMECFLSIKLELLAWAEALPPCCRYTPLIRLDIKNSNATIAVQRTLLHMLYYTIDLTLHRPQLLPPSPTQVMTSPSVVQGVSRLHVRNATIYITRMASELHHLGLDRFLPVTGVTVILPAMMMQLLEMRNAAPQARVLAARGFQQCVTNQDLEFTETDSGRQTLLAELNLDLAKGSPTPSAVAISKETSFADLTSSIEQEVIDWNTVTGTEVDLGQWLQFPPEEARQQ
ncbi:hypothetical protein NW765_009321 [Fusarium oxysporum]|nr:hypothetical protein NW765_009321 [Fusarium oxysporum]